jgi:hypothetical protein
MENYGIDVGMVRRLSASFLICVVFWGTLLFLICGCSQTQPPYIPSTPPLDLKPLEKELGRVGVFGGSAKAAITRAILEADKANASLAIIRGELVQADAELDKQQESLRIANLKINKVTKASEEKELEVQMLHQTNAKWRSDAEKYKVKYERLKKYKWAIVCICGWLLLKIVGSLGAWTPQGRIIKGLIG